MAKKKQSKTDRFYKFDVQISYKYFVEDEEGNRKNDMTEPEWRKMMVDKLRTLVFADNSPIKEIFYIFHDRDINKDGTAKGLHIHFIVWLNKGYAKSQSAAMKYFGATLLSNCQICNNYTNSAQYLCHISPGAIIDMKTVYLPEDVHGWRRDDEGNIVATTLQDFQKVMAGKGARKDKQEVRAIEDRLLDKVIDGDMTVDSVCENYLEKRERGQVSARDYLELVPYLNKAEDVYLQRLADFYKKHDCPKTLIYITGEGGSGKTTLAESLAKHWADDRGVHYVAVKGQSTTYDPAGDYCGQRVSVFNEFSTTFSVEQFCDVFDPMRGVNMSSRFRDKYYFANYCLFTSSVPLEVFIYQLFKNYASKKAVIPVNVRSALRSEKDWLREYIRNLPSGDDKIRQIRRRFAIMIHLENGFANIYCLDHSANVNQSFAFTPFNKIPNSPYSLFRKVPYNVSNSATIAKQTDFLMACVNDAINFFYIANGYVHPDKYEKPDFTEGKKK